MSDRGTIFLHIGTHKTGTTSLQVLLTSNDALLGTRGVLVPKTGRPVKLLGSANVGHHNIAWELQGVEPFDPSSGTLDELAVEISGAIQPTVVVSAENLCLLYDRPAELQRLARALASTGYRTTIVLYLRPQSSYLQSVFAEFVKHGGVASFSNVFEDVVRHGSFAETTFVYSLLIDAFAAVFGRENLIVRPYSPDCSPDDLLREFLAMLTRGAAAPIALDDLANPGKLNTPRSMMKLLNNLYAGAQRRRHVAPAPQALVDRLFSGDDRSFFNRPFNVLTRDEQMRLLERFSDDNRRVGEEYALRIPFVDPSDVYELPEALVASAAKQRALLDAATAAWKIDVPNTGALTKK